MIGGRILWHVKPCSVIGHAIRAAMGTVWETYRVWPVWTGCVMGRPSGITSHAAPYDHTPSSLILHPAPMHWWTRSSYWTLICFRSLALFCYLYDILLPKQWHSACSTCLQILIFPTPSAGVKGEPEERNEKIHIRTELPLKKIAHKKEIWQLFNFCKKSNSIKWGREVTAAENPTVRNLAVTHSLKMRPLLVFGCITD